MEENVALDSEKQKKFDKSIKGIKKLIKSGKITKRDDNEKVKPKKTRKPKKDKGLVYLSHIPHGFYEKEMTDYFKQFGGVTNVRVIRSKHTGKSKGHAFVEFANLSVAQIVAETMDNYLMGKRLLKASYIPPEKQRKAFRKKWNEFNNPGSNYRRKMKALYNTDKTEEEELKKMRKVLKNLSHTKKKLGDLGIDYSFFNAVDVPEQLLQTEKEDNGISSEHINKKQQKEKAQKPKSVDKKGPTKEKIPTKESKSLGEFVKIIKSDEESSDAFDSDEFDRLAGSEEDFDSDDSDSDIDSYSDEEVIIKSKTVKKNQKVLPTGVKKSKTAVKRGAAERKPEVPKKAKLVKKGKQEVPKKVKLENKGKKQKISKKIK